jgi:hypothetical protein
MANRVAQLFFVTWIVLLAGTALGVGEDLAALYADRTAVEHIYYDHRTGTKPPFEQALPPAQIEKMVKLDLKKGAVLKRVYKIDINQAGIDAEVQRINSTTRAPEVLTEIKDALGDDPKRFADTVARPLVVERRLREQFQNDARLHAPQRADAEQIRKKVLATKETKKRVALLKDQKKANPNEVTWQLTAPPTASTTPPSANTATPPAKVALHSADYSVEATAQLSQIIASPESAAKERERFYFEDVDPELQKVLGVQLQKPSDVSAVIEMPTVFLLFLCEEKTAQILRVASITIPKRSYDEWVAQQPD